MYATTCLVTWIYLQVVSVINRIIIIGSANFGTFHIVEQRSIRQFCANTITRQNLRCLHAQSTDVDNVSNKKKHMKIPKGLSEGGPTLTTIILVDKGRVDQNTTISGRTLIGPPAKHQLNGISLACWWWPNIECWLGSFVILGDLE